MDLERFQELARGTEQQRVVQDTPGLIPLLGIAGEVGELVNEYKKYLRDGEAHTRFAERLREELGDILWYVAATASQFGLSLDAIAASNLEKTQSRWLPNTQQSSIAARCFDSNFPRGEQFPRRMRAEFFERTEGSRASAVVMVDGRQLGQELTDNAHVADGYRFHDVFHLACVAVLGWSPVTRRNLGLKRRSRREVDEIEDGGRAIVTEEGISALVFAYAADHDRLNGVTTLDYSLLKAIRIMVTPFEVGVCTTGEWERAILQGYAVWKEIDQSRGGLVDVDLDHARISFVGPHAKNARTQE